MTFAEEIEEMAEGEPIEAVVIGVFGWGSSGATDLNDAKAYGFDKNNRKPIPNNKKCKPLDWDTARPYLNYNYDGGYGSPECHAIAAYTQSKVIFVSQYDGATALHYMLRNPGEFNPKMPGG